MIDSQRRQLRQEKAERVREDDAMLSLIATQNEHLAALQSALAATGETIEGAAGVVSVLEARIIAQDEQIALLKSYQHGKSLQARPVMDYEELEKIRFIEAVVEQDKEKMQ